MGPYFRKVVFWSLALVVLLLDSNVVFGNTIYVKLTSPDNGPGSSWNNAFHSITAAINSAAFGDNIWIASGTYAERITIKDAVSLYGGFVGNETSLSQRPQFPRPSPDPYETVLDGSQLGCVVTIPWNVGSNTALDGMSICKGYSDGAGAGIHCSSYNNPKLNNLKVFNNDGQGIYCHVSSPYITNSIIKNNSLNGIYVHENSSPYIEHCIISENSHKGIELDSYSYGTLINNIVVRNYHGIYVSWGSQPTVIKNTICENTEWGILADAPGSLYVNNIIVFNGSGIYASSSGPVFRNNCVFGNTNGNYQGSAGNLPGIDDISVDPLFIDRANGNYHISSGSSCIDTGDSSVIQSGWLDIDGEQRIYGSKADIGVDEFVGTPKVSLPRFIPDASSFILPIYVQVICDTLGSATHYTTNGSDPTESDLAITSGSSLLVDHTLTLKARAYKSSWDTSDVKTAQYKLTVETPVFDPDGGVYGSEQNVMISCNTAGAVIHYTTNGADPTESDPVVTSGSTVLVNHTLTLKARAYKSGYDASNIKSAQYTLKVATPVFQPDTNVLDNSGYVTISCATGGATIRYTTNGIDPTENDPIVASGSIVPIDYPLTLKAKAYKTGYQASDVISVQYTFKVSTPTFDPDGGSYLGARYVKISCNTIEAIIHYTTNGIDPTESDPVIASGSTVLIDKDQTLKAKAWRSGFEPSDVKSAEYSISYQRFYVKPNGNDLNSGLSWSQAKKTIQAAINAITAGEIWVMQGTYTERLSINERVSVYGGFSGTEGNFSQRNWIANPTIINGANLGSAVTIQMSSGQHNRFSGFTVQNGKNDYGGGLLSYGSPIIEDCVFTSNSATYYGGGIAILGGQVTIKRCKILGNNARWGGGISKSKYGVSAPAIILENSLIAENTALLGSGIFFDNNAGGGSIYNNTIVRNKTGPSFFQSTDGSQIVVRNCVIAFNDAGVKETGDINWKYNNVYGNVSYNYRYYHSDWEEIPLTGKWGNISQDPLFADLQTNDFHLTVNSPCIDTGDNSAITDDGIDIDGRARIYGARVDLGAYELPYKAATPQFSPASGEYDTKPLNITIWCRTPGASIHYTVDGTDPDESDPSVGSGGIAQMYTSGTLKARAYASGILPSEVASTYYWVSPTKQPQLNPDGGIFSGSVKVTVTAVTPGSVIRYTLDGTDPTQTSPIVASGSYVTVIPPAVLKVRAWASGLDPSRVKTAAYFPNAGGSPDEPETIIYQGPANSQVINVGSASFTYAGYDSVTPLELLRYAYRIDNSEWSDITTATTANLSNLNDGSHVFEVKAIDESGNQDQTPASRTFVVDLIPSTQNDSYTIHSGTTLIVEALGVLGNDSIDANDASIVENPLHGTVQLATNGSFTYTPASRFKGVDKFKYRTFDGTSYSNSAEVSINVTNQAPTAVEESIFCPSNSEIRIDAPGVLSNDSDPENDTLTAVLISGPAHGSVTLNPNGSYSYIPSVNFIGTDSFSYKADDGTEESALSAAVTINVEPRYVAYDLGLLPEGLSSEAYDINDQGLIVGEAKTSSGNLHAVYWQNGQITDIGTIDGGSSTAYAVNSSARIVGKSKGKAFTWLTNSFTNLGAGVAYDINGNNNVVGATGIHAAVWQQGVLTDIGAQFGSYISESLGINSSGRVVGYRSLPKDGGGYYLRGFLWNNGTVTNIGTFQGGTDSVATAINDSGIVVGRANLAGGIYHAFSWQNGVMTDLGSSSDYSSYAYDINSSGQIVGEVDTGEYVSGNLVYHAVLWFNSQIFDLNNIVINPDSWSYLETADAVNSSGRIAGTGVIGGQKHAFLLRPVSRPPLTQPDVYACAQNSSLSINAPGVLANDTDPEGDGMSVLYVSSTSYGTLTMNPNGAFTYVPNSGFNGQDPFE